MKRKTVKFQYMNVINTKKHDYRNGKLIGPRAYVSTLIL